MSTCVADVADVFVIDESGNMLTLYDDSKQSLGEVRCERASHVEMDSFGMWEVKLSDSPLNKEHANKVIGVFTTRKEALDYERDYINKNILGV